MKKLMIAAAIVCSAVMAQAAILRSFWGAEGLVNPASSTGMASEGSTYYFYAIPETSYTVAAAPTAFDADTHALTTSAATYNPFASHTVTAANLAADSDTEHGGYFFQGLDETFSASPGTDRFNAYIVLFDSETPSQAYVTTLSYSGSTVGELLESTGYFATEGNTSEYVTTTLLSVNVPEPTSGLLMLLGVAGLALKRKRA